MGRFSTLLRAGEGRRIRMLEELTSEINALEPEMEALSDAELQAKTAEFKARLADGETLDDLLIEAYAVVREAAWRVLGQRHFDVQLMGGMALHFGWSAEMRTGEGKTLVSTLPVYLNALSGRGVHVVTANDYLATRDAEWMGHLHSWLGLSVGRVGPDVTDTELKREAYFCDITYGTANEFGFDYLRDNMATRREDMVQREHVFAIVDEVDSILIDSARTPLIISGPSNSAPQLFYQFATLVRTLNRDEDYIVDEEKQTVFPTESGVEKIERATNVKNIYDHVSVDYVHHLQQAIMAKELYKRDKDYVVEDGEVKIVDEFTGRTMEGRRWSDGLHQAIEAKERVEIVSEDTTWASVTIQNFFLMYEKLAGMTGTAETEAAELGGTYGLTVAPIPTNREPQRIDQPDLIYRTEAEKFAAVVDETRKRHELGQPVLIGTASIVKSEQLSALLNEAGVPHEVLNAKQHFREAEIIAQAGRIGAVTVATNMAGRGVDILLGGNPEGLAMRHIVSEGLAPGMEGFEERFEELFTYYKEQCDAEGEQVRALGGLYVLGSERHESRRIDNQLRGRSGRQGEVGESRFMLSLEDELMLLFGGDSIAKFMEATYDEGEPIESRMVSRAVEKAQSTVEGRNASTRKDIFEYDEVVDAQRKAIYARRLRVIDGVDLHQETLELIPVAVEHICDLHASSDFPEEWELEDFVLELTRYYPTEFTAADLSLAQDRDHLVESVAADMRGYYEARRASFPGGEQTAAVLEREMMLHVIDLRWRDHMAELENVREGINLRSVAQLNPLTQWKYECYRLFMEMIDTINDEYLQYIMHVGVNDEYRQMLEDKVSEDETSDQTF